MKKILFVMIFLAIALTMLGSCASNSSSGNSNSAEADRLVWEGDYYLNQFEEYKTQESNNFLRRINPDFREPTESRLSPTKSSPFFEGQRSSPPRRPDWVRQEAASEQDIDRAIAAYERALALVPSGRYMGNHPPPATQTGPRVYATTGTPKRNPGVAIDINSRLTEARNAKNSWLTAEKPRLEQQLAAAQQQMTVPNSPEDFNFVQNAQGTITIRGYTGTRRAVVIPETISGIRVTEIAPNAFSISVWNHGTVGSRRPIHSVVIPDTVTSIGSRAFSNNAELSHVVLPNSITVIEREVFQDCRTLQSINIPNSVTTIGRDAFAGCGLTSVTFSNRLITIGEGAFANNQLTEVQFHPTLVTIHERAFSNNRITNLTLPNGMILLGEGSFAGNPLESIVIPPSLAEFSRNPAEGFRNAFNMRTVNRITLPANVDEQNLQGFDESFMNFWRLQNKRAGTYVNENRIWTARW